MSLWTIVLLALARTSTTETAASASPARSPKRVAKGAVLALAQRGLKCFFVARPLNNDGRRAPRQTDDGAAPVRHQRVASLPKPGQRERHEARALDGLILCTRCGEKTDDRTKAAGTQAQRGASSRQPSAEPHRTSYAEYFVRPNGRRLCGGGTTASSTAAPRPLELFASTKGGILQATKDGSVVFGTSAGALSAFGRRLLARKGARRCRATGDTTRDGNHRRFDGCGADRYAKADGPATRLEGAACARP